MRFSAWYIIGGFMLLAAIGSIAQGLNRIAAAIEGLQKDDINNSATSKNKDN